ncbi:hypothetical protein CHLNCDRAFT_133495 [Chlorella variabilis]|uniref:Mitochodrial transcription termination factor-related protein n=1 Tax=Chlorella variabilis TaxID=554065 RepID=E1Z383_CHLVA|nr:hypothetical protein CHLNCDRAFT_133495 [Chlorella variabilis]EFN60127.1 hypothetical protein CHLNCDRAFT_133495 [Chlorella variabilis]|eukprot:XP_005852229.1 hypothetical protein CHLNCDRAFT_133495 [Chlorella variabilis]
MHAQSLLSGAAVELAPEQQEQWAACSEVVQQRCGLEAAAAESALLKAFGWKGQGFWRQERVKQCACQEQVAAALDFLSQLGIAEPADLGGLVSSFPEVLGLRVDVMEENVGILRNKWFLKGNVLINTIKRKPRVLGNLIDCEGNCAGMCTRCWAQF